MRFDDIKKLATGSVLFNLDRIIAPRIVTVFYFLGLAGILVWAINHFFYSFRFGFGNGLWGILEIVVFGLLAFVILRMVCEAVIVFFRVHSREAAQSTHPRASGSLLDVVRDAIEELADQEEEYDDVETSDTGPAPSRAAAAQANPPAADTTAEDTATRRKPATTSGKVADEGADGTA